LLAVIAPTEKEIIAIIATGLKFERYEYIISGAFIENIIFFKSIISNIAIKRLKGVPFLKKDISLFFDIIVARITPIGRAIRKDKYVLIKNDKIIAVETVTAIGISAR